MTVLDARDVTKVFREGSGCVTVLKGASLSLDRESEIREAARGPVGVRKDHIPDDTRLYANPLLGTAQHRWPRGRPEAARPAPCAPTVVDRIRVPAISSVPSALTAAENVSQYVLNLKGD